ncbi:hypothetical protein [Natronococcus wangiae]|uniref:hypothetical protein n=1 Tax=Natronococcus wangiae TaxID=3068275 RepID=UPI00273F917A|nr:hypothetical protein [Natronococcus sp. AD5]
MLIRSAMVPVSGPTSVGSLTAIELLAVPIAIVDSPAASVLVLSLVPRAVGASVASPFVVWIAHGVVVWIFRRRGLLA